MKTLEIILQLISSKYPSDASFEIDCKLPPKTVYDWKRGKSKSYLKILPQIAELFKVPIAYLYGISEQKNKPTTVSDGELDSILQDPAVLEFAKKFSELTSDQKEWMTAQIDGILSRRTDK